MTDLGTAYVGTADFTGGVGRVLIPIRKGNYSFCEVFTESSMGYGRHPQLPADQLQLEGSATTGRTCGAQTVTG